MERQKQRLLFPPLSLNDRSLVQVSEARRDSFASARLKHTGRLSTNRSDGFAQHRTSATPMKARPAMSPSKPRPRHTRVASSVESQEDAKTVECPWKLSEIVQSRCIGQGSLGRITLAEVKGRQIALKTIDKTSVKVRRVAEAEKSILEKLKHPLMVAYYGSIEDSGKLHLVLEYLPKGDLFHLMRRKRLKQKEIWFFAAETACGLRYLHDRRIVYRDLKPENLMLSASGHIKFIDFGFAKQLISDRTNSVLGSPEYMAPELVMKRPHGLAVDCWSFGILLHPPFQGNSPMEVYEKVIEGLYEIPPHVDASAKDLIRKLLNPEARFRPTIEVVQTHAYFQDADWSLVSQLQLDPPTFDNLPEKPAEQFQTDLFDS